MNEKFRHFSDFDLSSSSFPEGTANLQVRHHSST
jgi:hypothetical protein